MNDLVYFFLKTSNFLENHRSKSWIFSHIDAILFLVNVHVFFQKLLFLLNKWAQICLLLKAPKTQGEELLSDQRLAFYPAASRREKV